MSRPLSFVLALALAAVPAAAAPPEHADPSYAAWFQAQRLPGASIPCCDVSDGRTVEMRYSNGRVEALVTKAFPHTPQEWQDRWVEVPEDRILHNVGNPTGRPVLWWTPWYGVLCFSLPPET